MVGQGVAFTAVCPRCGYERHPESLKSARITAKVHMKVTGHRAVVRKSKEVPRPGIEYVMAWRPSMSIFKIRAAQLGPIDAVPAR